MPINPSNIKLAIDRTRAVKNIVGKNVITLISLGSGLNGSKSISSEGNLHLELLNHLNKFSPKLNIILVAGALKRWNYWEILEHITDIQLKKTLSDIPKDIKEKKLACILAEKFSDIAAKLEAEYINEIDTYLNSHPEDIKKLTFKYKITAWNQKHLYNNITKQDPQAIKFMESPEFIEKMKETKTRFLQNKKSLLDKAQDRIKQAQPNLASIDFKKVTDEACLQYLLEEYVYFAKLNNTEIYYTGKIPPAIKPIFEIADKDIFWREIHFKLRKKNNTAKTSQEEKLNAVELNNNSSDTTIINTLTSFFSKRNMCKLQIEEKSQTDVEHRKSESMPIPIQQLSPKISKQINTLIHLFSTTPPSEEKKLAAKKLEEATSLLKPLNFMS
ncbi:hypothetical protein N9L02_01330 [Gammaproteobacteria bacterium]|nr:hypothetical protein [Gammaproteobacteria bacterium]